MAVIQVSQMNTSCLSGQMLKKNLSTSEKILFRVWAQSIVSNDILPKTTFSYFVQGTEAERLLGKTSHYTILQDNRTCLPFQLTDSFHLDSFGTSPDPVI